MADKNKIPFSVEIDGIEQSIKSVKDLKTAIKTLQDQAETLDLGSDEYKNTIQQLEALNDKLKEVSQTEKQAAQSVEDLAKAEKEATKETQDLRKQFEVLEDELFLLAGQGKQNTKQFKDLTIEAAALNKRIDEVNSSLGGNETERAALGFGKLKEGLKNLDFKSVKEGLTAIKTALAATGVMLVVMAVNYLVENFDELSKGTGLLAKVLQGVGAVITYVKDQINEFTDSIGLTDTALDKLGDSLKTNADNAKEALSKQTAEYDRQIAIAKASGKSAVDLEKAKQQAIIESNKALIEQTIAYVRQGGILNKEQRDLLSGQLEAIKGAVNQQKVVELTDNKERLDKYKTHLEEKRKLELEAYKKRLEDTKANEKSLNDARLALDSAYNVDKLKLEDDLTVSLDPKLNERRIKELEGFRELEKQKYQLANQGLQGIQALSDVFFLFKSSQVKKGSKEEEENAKKAFQVNKALQLSTATINGIQGVQGAFTTATASPITTVFPAYPFVQAGLAGVFAAASIAKIAASQFKSSGGGGGVSAPSAPNISIPAPPVISTASNNINSNTLFDENGKRIGGEGKQTISVSATIGVDEVKKKMDKVDVLEKQSTF